MIYRRKLGNTRATIWVAMSAILAADLLRQGRPIWMVALGAAAVILAFYIPHLFWNWKILPDRLVQSRYFQRTVFPFSEITYIGPMTGRAARRNAVQNWILIRNTANERMIAMPANPEAFLAELRTYLPQITLHL